MFNRNRSTRPLVSRLGVSGELGSTQKMSEFHYITVVGVPGPSSTWDFAVGPVMKMLKSRLNLGLKRQRKLGDRRRPNRKDSRSSDFWEGL